MRKIITALFFGLTLITTIIKGFIPTKADAQSQEYLSAGLHGLSDVISSSDYSAPSVEHRISFTLPFDSFPIRKTDYIRIYFEFFSDITVPIYVFGDYAGIPVYSVTGNYVEVTGIRAQPGAYISIEGITTTNPADDDHFTVVTMVTDGSNFGVVKNIGSTRATLNRGSVTMTASIERELSTLVISGYTSPYAFLIFSEDSSVLGTDVSNQAGGFYKYFSGIQPTTHNITFYAVDQYNFNTTPQPITIYTPAYQETTISNQLLSPTISIDTTSLEQGTDIVASGSAVPGGQITLLTDMPLRSYVASAAADGSWNYTINNTSEYVWGDYRTYAIAQTTGGLQSLTSPSVLFSITAESASGTSCGDITEGDLNCDGSINLQDFSILMYYWGTTNAAADINSNNIVNLSDFSIMMYYWGT